MKGQPLIITEHHFTHAESPAQAIRQVISAWLTKALHQ